MQLSKNCTKELNTAWSMCGIKLEGIDNVNYRKVHA